MKGEPRRLSWSSRDDELYIRTTEGDKPSDAVHHYLVAESSGELSQAPSEPDWAIEYWTFKSDRYAPDMPSLVIDVAQGAETIKIGTGSAGAIDSNRSDPTTMSAGNIDREAQRQKERVVRLTLLGETIGRFVNVQPLPGLTFGWGPAASGAIVFADLDGRLILLDASHHKQTVAGVKDAILPAWSTDGRNIAFLRKTGRKKYTLSVVDITRR